MLSTKKLVLLAIFVSQALILSIIESWIPIPVAIPGVKLGLANIVTLVVIIFFGFRDALLVVLLRVALASVFAGNPVIFLFSIAGGVLSTVVMALLYKRFSKLFSVLGVSIAGSIAHNLGQILAASAIMRELSAFGYLPVLLVSGIIMGIFVGFAGSFLTQVLKRTGVLNRFNG